MSDPIHSWALLAKAYGASTSDALRAGAVGFVTAVAYNVAGNMGQSYGAYAHFAAHAAAGCISSAAGGGNCGTGALSGIAGLAGTYATRGLAMQYQFIGAAVAGGTASVIGGGRFANGAVTGAFGYLFNCLAHEACAQNMTRDSRGGYLEQRCVGSECFTVRLNGLCGDMTCQQNNVNVDWASSKEYAKALKIQMAHGAGTIASVGAMVTPVGIPGAVAGGVGLVATGSEFYLTRNPDSLVPPFVGARVSNWLLRAGVSEAWAQRAGEGVSWLLGEAK